MLETSLIFFNGRFSHAVRKNAKDGEFRIHWEHGGTQVTTTPSRELVAQAESILKMVNETLLFARIDLIERAQGPLLVEFEMYELGLNPNDPEDIKLYWKVMLND